jgi:hypothetical protein
VGERSDFVFRDSVSLAPSCAANRGIGKNAVAWPLCGQRSGQSFSGGHERTSIHLIFSYRSGPLASIWPAHGVLVRLAFLAHVHFARSSKPILISYLATTLKRPVLSTSSGHPSLRSTSAKFSNNLHDKISYQRALQRIE